MKTTSRKPDSVSRENITPAGGQIGADHLHYADGERHRELVVTVIRPIVDGAVGEQTREAPAAGIQKALVPLDVQIGVVLAGETGVGQVFGGRGAPHRHADVFRVAGLKLAIRGQCLFPDCGGQGRAVDELPCLSPTALEVFHIVGIQVVENVMQPGGGARLLEDQTIGVGGNGESIRDQYPPGAQIPVHLAQGSVLSSYRGHVFDAQFVEKPNEPVGTVWSLSLLRGCSIRRAGSRGVRVEVGFGGGTFNIFSAVARRSGGR